jgi:predicted GNAT family acetyltransferase
LVIRHQELAEVRGRARKYRSDVSVFAAVDTFDPASWADLAHLVGPSHTCALFRGDVPSDLPRGWTGVGRVRCQQMLVEADRLAAPTHLPLRRLTPDDVPLMLDLVAVTDPGPFRSGTIAMGRYWGYFEGDRLVSMAGERLGFDGYTEISAVCTHPDVQGRGFGSALTRHAASEILDRGERPFLHVAESNTGALRVYEKLGFVQTRLVEAVLVRPPR